RVVACALRPAGPPAAIVRRIAVRVAVRHHEVDPLPGERRGNGWLRELAEFRTGGRSGLPAAAHEHRPADCESGYDEECEPGSSTTGAAHPSTRRRSAAEPGRVPRPPARRSSAERSAGTPPRGSVS